MYNQKALYKLVYENNSLLLCPLMQNLNPAYNLLCGNCQILTASSISSALKPNCLNSYAFKIKCLNQRQVKKAKTSIIS